MPLLAGRKNIGHNIEVEQEHGKPHKQAVAIALSKARRTGDDAMHDRQLKRDVANLKKMLMKAKSERYPTKSYVEMLESKLAAAERAVAKDAVGRRPDEWRAKFAACVTPGDVGKLTREYNKEIDGGYDQTNPGEFFTMQKAAKERVASSNMARPKTAEEARVARGMEHTKRRPDLFRGRDDLMPVGEEDPERAVALKRHEEGLTKSQDKTKARDGVKCQCESSVGCGHGGGSCGNTATRDVPTIYGGYKMCRTCAEALPAEYKKGSDMKRARDIQASEIRERLGISEAEWAKLDKSARQDKAREALARGKDEVMPVGDAQITEYEQGLRKHIANLKKEPQSAMRDRLIRTAQLAIEKGITREDAARLIAKAKDTELPTAVKTSNLVPMPSGEHDEVSYAPRRVMARDRGRFKKVGDDGFKEYADTAAKNWEPFVEKLKANIDGSRNARVRRMNQEVYDDAKKALEGLRTAKDMRSFNMWADSLRFAKRKATDARTKATDAKAILPLQTSGSDPADHMRRAAEYEIAGDRARALDSYRAAASGWRRANDRANEAKARDGVEACQSKFAAQYDHPGAGRVKVCDSAEAALRTAVERTRAGEIVSVVGKTVRPGRARVGDANAASDPHLAEVKKTWNAKIYQAYKNKYNSEGKEAATKYLQQFTTRKLSAKDEHEGFKKLEGKLSHEKGVTNPAALAASIGRKKYGEKGMAKKSAAARDVMPVPIGDTKNYYDTEAAAKATVTKLARTGIKATISGSGKSFVVEYEPADPMNMLVNNGMNRKFKAEWDAAHKVYKAASAETQKADEAFQRLGKTKGWQHADTQAAKVERFRLGQIGAAAQGKRDKVFSAWGRANGGRYPNDYMDSATDSYMNAAGRARDGKEVRPV